MRKSCIEVVGIAAVVMLLTFACGAQGTMIAQWTFNEDSGGALDYSGNVGQDATLVGSPVRITDGTRRYLELNGTSQYAYASAGRVPGSPTEWTALNDAPVASGDVTVTAWVRVDSGTVLMAEPAIGKLIKISGTWYNRFGITFSGTAGTNGRVYSYVMSTGGTPTSAADSIFDGNWHNITLTFDGGVAGTDAYLYFDGGAAVASADLDSVIAGGDLNFMIGAKSVDGDWRYLDGGIDEVRVYDTALSQSEVQALVDAGPVPIPEPVTLSLLGLGAVLGLIRRR